MYDLVVRGGLVVDGTGAHPRPADVAVVDGRIAAVGDDLGPAEREIDARGLLVTPGFVDLDTAYDARITWDADLSPSVLHGVTTVVTGARGVGIAPAGPERRRSLLELLAASDGVPAAGWLDRAVDAADAATAWHGVTFEDHLDELEAKARPVDFAVQVTHAAVRSHVLGDRADDRLAADADAEVAAMAALVGDAVRAGAIGCSAQVAARPTVAERTELLTIARAVVEAGGVPIVLCSRPDRELDVSDRAVGADDRAEDGDELLLALAIAEETGLPVRLLLSDRHDGGVTRSTSATTSCSNGTAGRSCTW